MELECMTPGAWQLVLALLLGVALDIAYPRHEGVLLAVHPVRTSYLLSRRLARPFSGALRGALVVVAVLASHLAPAALLLWAACGSPMAWVVAAAIIVKLSAPLRLLVDTCLEAARLLDEGRVVEARSVVGGIVRRDTRGLDEALLSSAAIESLAENLVDGFTSPITYYPLLGPLGPMMQRIVNTLDGAIGYKTPEYLRVGMPAAHLDSLVNLLPARATALLIIALSPLAGCSPRGALRSWLSWRGATESINAGHTMAAMAGALGVRLEKPGSYVINPGGRPPGPRDVRRAVALSILVAAAYLSLVAAAVALLYS